MSASIEISRRCGRACQTGIENLAITTTRLAYSRAEAAEALGISLDHFDRHVAPEVRVVRRGRRRLYPIRELERWLEHSASLALEDR